MTRNQRRAQKSAPKPLVDPHLPSEVRWATPFATALLVGYVAAIVVAVFWAVRQ
jgi:hypothetical protein